MSKNRSGKVCRTMTLLFLVFASMGMSANVSAALYKQFYVHAGISGEFYTLTAYTSETDYLQFSHVGQSAQFSWIDPLYVSWSANSHGIWYINVTPEPFGISFSDYDIESIHMSGNAQHWANPVSGNPYQWDSSSGCQGVMC